MPIHTAALDDIPPRTLYALLKLRVDAFVVEQACPYPELDGRDLEPEAQHVWAEDDDGEVLAYLRVLREPEGRARIGRVVTAPGARRGGHAARLMIHALGLADGPVDLGAQAHLAGWYARFGFQVSGPEYDEDGIPHVPMALER